MIARKPLAPNNRTNRMSEFLSSLESGAAPITYPKSNEKSSIFHHLRAGRQNSEGFGGGNRVMR